MVFGSFKKAIPLIVTSFLVFSAPAHSQTPNVVVTPQNTATATAGSSTAERQEAIDAVTDAVCDPNVYERMKQKARAEAERETYVNQSLILRPDSLFDITCFSQQMAQNKNGCIPDANGNTTACENTVNSIAGNAASFSSGAVGGRASLTPNKNAPRGANGSTVLPTTEQAWEASPNRNTPFRCEEMRKLWQQAQCANFNAGDLPSLREAGSSRDARNYPNVCTANLTGSTGNTLVAGVPNKDDQQGSALYGDARTRADIYAPLANQPNAAPANTQACKTAPFSQLSGLGCQNETGQVDLCSARPEGTTEITVQGSNVKALIGACQPGCSAQLSGNKLICKKTP